mmetsp:Transcript_1507/g.3174  ORF Transcript_1507/g.3174 Transcript_1507/m.3174 type:complete len:200 (-) Transcript_1507:291-890(-)
MRSVWASSPNFLASHHHSCKFRVRRQVRLHTDGESAPFNIAVPTTRLPDSTGMARVTEQLASSSLLVFVRSTKRADVHQPLHLLARAQVVQRSCRAMQDELPLELLCSQERRVACTIAFDTFSCSVLCPQASDLRSPLPGRALYVLEAAAVAGRYSVASGVPPQASSRPTSQPVRPLGQHSGFFALGETTWACCRSFQK